MRIFKFVHRNDDSNLWIQFIKGDKKAAEQIYIENYTHLYNYGIKFTKDSHLIEDTIHELFTYLLTSTDKISKDVNIKAYLMTSLRNNLVNRLKKNSKELPENEELNFYYDNSAEDILIYNETTRYLAKQLREILLKLSARQREAIYLKYFLNYSYDEIVEIMGINYQSARRLVYSSLKEMKKIAAPIEIMN